jgi:hypothetical protein
MAISIVNGFVCTSSCDVAKAKKGEDPHPATGAEKIAKEKEEKASDPLRAGDPAVVFGGALARLSATAAVQPTDAARATGSIDPRTPGSSLDLTV